MTAEVVQFRDYDRPRVCVRRDDPAEVIVLPVVRIERYVADVVADGARERGRRSLLGDA